MYYLDDFGGNMFMCIGEVLDTNGTGFYEDDFPEDIQITFVPIKRKKQKVTFTMYEKV